MKRLILLAALAFAACNAATASPGEACRDAVVAPLWGAGACPDPRHTIERHTDGDHICRCAPEGHAYELSI